MGSTIVVGGDVFRGMSVASWELPTSPGGSVLVTPEIAGAGNVIPPPHLIRTARDVGGNVDIRVFRIEGFKESQSMFDKTDPFVR